MVRRAGCSSGATLALPAPGGRTTGAHHSPGRVELSWSPPPRPRRQRQRRRRSTWRESFVSEPESPVAARRGRWERADGALTGRRSARQHVAMIEPFTLAVPDAELEDLRARLR